MDEYLISGRNMREVKEILISFETENIQAPGGKIISYSECTKFVRPTGDQVRKWALAGSGDLGIISLHKVAEAKDLTSCLKTSPADISQGCEEIGNRTGSKGKPSTFQERAEGQDKDDMK